MYSQQAYPEQNQYPAATNNVVSVFDNSENKSAIKKLLPRHISIDKFMQIANTAAMQFPDLQECTPESLFVAFSRCAQDGLIPDGREAAIVSYNKKQGNTWIKVAQYQPMVEGVLKRLRMSSQVKNVIAKVVYENENFNHWIDIDGEHLMHQPVFDDKRGELKLVYALAKLDSGEKVVEVMLKSEVEEIMMNSKSAVDKNGVLKPYSVWATHFPRMALKTVIHRITRRLPNASEVAEMLEREIDYKLVSEDRQPQTIEHNQNQGSQDREIIPLEQQMELKKLVEQTGSDENNMFNWISNKTEILVSSYDQLDFNQFTRLKTRLENAIAKQVAAQRQQAMEQSGEFVSA
ncbi:recombinase RecT [Hydrogenovibrio marinus]|uniref:Recombinase RecT n=1 Tax=Hydrogenovibrio marinus TaxID=28885 RepID=A0A066ZWF0_HYDMR|nr:recombinase RecT [Hydrogenovibrio marinus]KDN94661.1 hypothetical protein EI16_12235 [Hydrogenovibrio marinus]